MKRLTRHQLPAPVEEGLRGLLESLGFAADAPVEPHSGGGNNRAFVAGDGVRRVFVKWYFDHPGDPRDRLQAEWAFTRFAWEHGIRTVPEPLAADPACRLAAYEFIGGRLLNPDEITTSRVDEAVRFVAEINALRGQSDANRLAPASEACFSIAAHWRLVETRIARLAEIGGASNKTDSGGSTRRIDDEAARFVADMLQPAWVSVREASARLAREAGIDVERSLKPSERCLSPSDFGFHNALLEANGRLRFIDFEYSGWDDPAKLACDFFCQVRAPVPAFAHGPFLEQLVRDLDLDETFRQRVEILLPVYRLKWCAIVLNEFLPVAAARRKFSKPSGDAAARKKEQLDKARGMVESVRSTGSAR